MTKGATMSNVKKPKQVKEEAKELTLEQRMGNLLSQRQQLLATLERINGGIDVLKELIDLDKSKKK